MIYTWSTREEWEAEQRARAATHPYQGRAGQRRRQRRPVPRLPNAATRGGDAALRRMPPRLHARHGRLRPVIARRVS